MPLSGSSWRRILARVYRSTPGAVRIHEAMNLAAMDHSRPRYSVTPAWIHGVMDSGAACRSVRNLRLALHRGAFSALLPLLRHDALRADVDPAEEPCLVRLVGKVFQGSTVKRFVADARRVSGDGTLS